jgi:NDP-sugar pyrophosphorylase family protein
MELFGRRSHGGEDEIARGSRQAEPLALAFAGIHTISPRIFSMMSEEGVFSIITTYMRLAGQGEKIMGFRADEYYWRDLGTPENVRLGAEDIRQKALL